MFQKSSVRNKQRKAFDRDGKRFKLGNFKVKLDHKSKTYVIKDVI